MKLTEAKLKQMIVEALKDKKIQEVKTKTLRSFMESHGFNQNHNDFEMDDKLYRMQSYDRFQPAPYHDRSEEAIMIFDFHIVNDGKGQKIGYSYGFDEVVNQTFIEHEGYIKVPDMPEFDPKSDEDAEVVFALILEKEMARIEKIVVESDLAAQRYLKRI